MRVPRPLPRAFYLRDTVDVARALLGCILWRRLEGDLLAVRIVETEAYLGANDPASHARRGLRTPRNESMYGEGGQAYVYFTYGMHHCMNVVTSEEGIPEAVLLRAAEPIAGIDAIRVKRPKASRDQDLLNGPGKLCMGLRIDRSMDGTRLDGLGLFITKRDRVIDESEIVVTPRVGIDGAGDAAAWPLRFYLEGSRHVSRR